VTTTVAPPVDPDPPAALQARIRLKPADGHPGMVNGTRRPHSRDLVRELPPLIAALDKAWGKSFRGTALRFVVPPVPSRP